MDYGGIGIVRYAVAGQKRILRPLHVLADYNVLPERDFEEHLFFYGRIDVRKKHVVYPERRSGENSARLSCAAFGIPDIKEESLHRQGIVFWYLAPVNSRNRWVVEVVRKPLEPFVVGGNRILRGKYHFLSIGASRREVSRLAVPEFLRPYLDYPGAELFCNLDSIVFRARIYH